MELLANIRHFGCIVYGSDVEIWKMKGQRGPMMDQSYPFFPSCQIHALDRLDVSRADNVAILREFVTVVTR